MYAIGVRKACFCVVGLVALVCPRIIASQVAQDCGAKQFDEKLDRKQIRDLQRWVNQGHEPWRIDNPELVAHQKLLELADSVKGFGAHQPSPQRIVNRRDYVVLLYRSVAGSRTYRVTLKKFDWLLPVAGRINWVIWVPTQVELSGCL